MYNNRYLVSSPAIPCLIAFRISLINRPILDLNYTPAIDSAVNLISINRTNNMVLHFDPNPMRKTNFAQLIMIINSRISRKNNEKENLCIDFSV